MKIDATKLREYLNTMHGHADARDVQSESIRKVIQTAKTDGFDGKALRKVFVRERMDPEQRQKDDDTLAIYEAALGAKGRALRAIEAGAGVEEAAKANGLHRATVSRARNVAKQPENATPAHDADTGEIIEETADRKPLGGEQVRAETEAASGQLPAKPIDARTFDEIAGEMPPHLRRVKAA